MRTLRLTQTTVRPGEYRIELALREDNQPEQTASAPLAFILSPEDQRDMRWYLEDYLQYPEDPAPAIAARVEARMRAIGIDLFEQVLEANRGTRRLWDKMADDLAETRVEIRTGVLEAATLPWELLHDPLTDVPLALRARSFVRTYSESAQRARLPECAEGEAIRILLVICRPGRNDDVPFRSVAMRLLEGLNEETSRTYQLDVLRPPTFAQLGRVLRRARDEGQPYHIVHFDGHGVYTEVQPGGGLAGLLRGLGSLVLAAPRTGRHGYLLFENPRVDENAELVDGPSLGALLAETGVPVLVLNACRSAHAEGQEESQEAPPLSPPRPADRRRSGHGGEEETCAPGGPRPTGAAISSPSPVRQPWGATGEGWGGGSLSDIHAQVRALGSLAQEAMDAGVAGVVAMRYNVYVVTAAQFVADLYAALAQGRTLGQAVTMGRKQLDAQPLREIAFEPRRLQDWVVPVVYEAAPIALFRPRRTGALDITLRPTAGAAGRGDLDAELPQRPDVGFYGRHETLLALDRAFDTQQIVLLHAYAGSGKTAAAAEFARWYAGTGGVEGPVFFTSFEQYTPLARVLDPIERAFGPALEQAGVNWLALEADERRGIALQVLRQAPVLWIWDNVEPVSGFPAGTESAWSAAEQRELVDFLRAARDTRAKFLLTSRRDERPWLGELPARVELPPMPEQERVQLARALAERLGRRLGEVEDWRPLLRFTQGNPLTITVLVGQALRDGLRTREQIGAFLRRLYAGEEAFEDEAARGRARSLGASLSYGFEHAFSEDERRQLALLHFFQGFVDVNVLRQMGHPERDYCLPEVRGLTREAGISLLDRAAEVGLLDALGGGTYRIHPALPWYFRSLFETYYVSSSAMDSPPPQTDRLRSAAGEPIPMGEGPGVGASLPSTRLSAARAYVEAMGELGNHYTHEYNQGNRDVIAALRAEEANLLHARRLARRHGWWDPVTSAMQGLQMLYRHTGRRGEWAHLVDEIAPDFCDPETGGPLPGREDEWDFVIQYRVLLAEEARRWDEAERLQRARVEWNRQRAAPALAAPPEALDGAGRNAIRSLAVSLEALGNILREQEKPECVVLYEEAAPLCQRIDDKPEEAVIAFNLGHAYMDLPALRDLAAAERWYSRGLELIDERDQLTRGKGLGELGSVAYERFRDALEAGQGEEEQLRHLNDAVQFYTQALDLLPTDAVDGLAVSHNQLGLIYQTAGDLDRALPHYREAVRYFEVAGNLYNAGLVRENVALALRDAGRLADALAYARAALRNYQSYGQGAADRVERARRLIAAIEGEMGRG